MPQQSQKDARSLYHRWRSSSFAEVIAQEHVTRTLRNAVAHGRTVHAYLFCGPRGTGKTSTARILAKAVNCLDPREGEPCNRCPACLSVNEGRAIDLIEIDAASNRGIDDARELREKIKFAPAEFRYKVYIIDEAHMLTSEASNALLKTLEEPPEHAILILATTETHKILPTIASRCQRFDFRRIPLPAIISQLDLICAEEGIAAEPGVLDRVGRMARGSLRDAESLLDQLAAYCGNQIGLEMAREVLGLAGDELVPDLAEAIRARDLVAGLRIVDSLASRGADLRHFARELVDYLRALLVVKSGAETSLVQEYRPEELARLRSGVDGWEFGRLLNAIRAFGDLDSRLKQEAFGQVHLEMAFVEAALPGEGGAIPAQLAEAPSARQQTATATPEPGSPSAAEQGVVEGPPAPASDAAGPGMSSEPDSGGSENARDLDVAALTASWSRVLSELSSSGAIGIAAALRGGHPVGVSGNVVSLAIDEKPLWKNTLERPGAKSRVEAVLSNLFGTKVEVRFQFGVKTKRPSVPPERDAVVRAAVQELGFSVTRVEPTGQADG